MTLFLYEVFMENKKYSQEEKVAILLLCFGKDISSEHLKMLGEYDRKKVSLALNKLGRVEEKQVLPVLDEFLAILDQQKDSLSLNQSFMKRVLRNINDSSLRNSLENFVSDQDLNFLHSKII